MRWTIETRVPENSFDYFEKTLITPNGFREYDVRWLLGKRSIPSASWCSAKPTERWCAKRSAKATWWWGTTFACTARTSAVLSLSACFPPACTWWISACPSRRCCISRNTASVFAAGPKLPPATTRTAGRASNWPTACLPRWVPRASCSSARSWRAGCSPPAAASTNPTTACSTITARICASALWRAS